MSILLGEGTVLSDRYEIRRVLGQGGMGAVYLAEDRRIPEKLWAVKELWDFGDPRTRELVQDSFHREAAILASLDHPNLPRITDFFIDNNREYLVMDYVEGMTLEEKLAEVKGPLEIEQILEIISQLLSVLEYIHSQNPPVIFRDLKPANIMLCPDKKVKLIDFGIARIFSGGKKKDTVVMGTPGFAAPEQYGTGQSDARSDIYGLGAVIYFCITGQDPSENPFHFDSPSSINPKVFPRLEKAVLQCVQMEPEKRFAGAVELRDYLFAPGGVTASISPDAAGTRPPPPDTKILQGAFPEPDIIDGGSVKKGENRKRHFIIRGVVRGVSLKADVPWIRVYPSLADGADCQIGVTIYTSSLNHGGRYSGNIMMKGDEFSATVPVKVDVEARHLNFLTYILVFLFTLVSLLPGIGLVGFLYNLVSYFSLPKGERKSLKVFFYVTLFATLLWVIVGVFWFGIFQLGWFKNLIFN